MVKVICSNCVEFKGNDGKDVKYYDITLFDSESRKTALMKYFGKEEIKDGDTVEIVGYINSKNGLSATIRKVVE